MLKITRILFILSSASLLSTQTTEDLKRFMNTYDQLKLDQQANEVVKKGIESEKDPTEGPVRLLIDPGDMTKYYNEKMNVIKKDLDCQPCMKRICPLGHHNCMKLIEATDVLNAVNSFKR